MENKEKRSLFSWYYGKASIKTKLVISYILLVTIPILVLGGYSFTVSRKNMERQTLSTMENNLNLMASELEVSLKRENDNIRYLSYNTVFRQTLKNSAGDPVAVAQVLNQVVEPTFWYFITSDNNMKGIETFSPYDKAEVGSFLKPEEACREESWYRWHENNFGTLWTFEDGALFATRTLLDAPTSSEPIGILKLEVYPYSILETVRSMDYLNNGILVTDADGQVLYSRETGYEEVDQKVRQEVLGEAEKREPAPDDAMAGSTGSRDYFLMRQTVEESGWEITYYVARTEIMGQLDQIIRSTAVVVVLCLLIVVMMISFLSSMLSRRILELKKSAEQVAEGDFHLNISPGYRDEIGVVAASLQTMCDRLNEMIERVYKAELEKKVMELKALQAMINPHFLYNCLSSIKWKAMMGGNDEISEITGLLAKFYRTSLNGGRQITTVGSELENIRSYIELQQMTRGNKFRVEYDLKEEGFHYPMPNFLLQPLVENAIEHGLNYQDEQEEGLLVIRFEVADEFLVFRILNNGPPIGQERLEEVLNRPGKGYGIFNIRERIRIYYGEGCGLSGEVTDEGYTCFTVRLFCEIGEF